MPAGIEKNAAAMDLFGKSGQQLIPFLDQGSAGIERLREEARALGIVLDEETVGAGADLGDSLTKLQRSAGALRNLIAGPLLVPLRKLVDGMLDWWKANQEIIKQRFGAMIAAVLPVALALAAVIGALGRVVYWVALGVSFLVEHLAAVAMVILGRVLPALAAKLAALVANAGGVWALVSGYAALALAALSAAAKAAAASTSSTCSP
jgi:hypothetical protein